MIRATTTVVVPTGLAGGNVFSHRQAVRNCLRDKIIKCAVHGAHICFEPISFSAVMGATPFSQRTINQVTISHVMQCSDHVKMKQSARLQYQMHGEYNYSCKICLFFVVISLSYSASHERYINFK